MNTSFRPSEFDKQAAASLDMIDEQAAAERVQRILHPEPQGARSQAQAGPTLTPQEKKVVQQLGANPSEVDRVDVYRKLPDGKLLPIEGGVDMIATAPEKTIRRTRSDKGTHKPKAPADPDEIVLKFTIEQAQRYATDLRNSDPAMSAAIFNQIITQIKKRLDQLQKQK